MKLNRSESLAAVAPVDALSLQVARSAAESMAESAGPLVRSVEIVGAMVTRVGGGTGTVVVRDEVIQLFRAKNDDLAPLADFLRPESLRVISSLDTIMNIRTGDMAEQLGHLSKAGPIAGLLGLDADRRGKKQNKIGGWIGGFAKKADRMIASRLHQIPDELLALAEIPQIRGQLLLLWLSVDHLNRAHEVRLMAESSVESLLSADEEWAERARGILNDYQTAAKDLKEVESKLDAAIDRGLGLNLAETEHGSASQVEAMGAASDVSSDTAVLQRSFVGKNKVVTQAVLDFHRRMVSLKAGNTDLEIRQGILTAAMLGENAAAVVVDCTIRAIKTVLASTIRTRMQEGARLAIKEAGEYRTALELATESAMGILSDAEAIVRDAATKSQSLLPEGVIEGEFRE